MIVPGVGALFDTLVVLGRERVLRQVRRAALALAGQAGYAAHQLLLPHLYADDTI